MLAVEHISKGSFFATPWLYFELSTVKGQNIADTCWRRARAAL